MGANNPQGVVNLDPRVDVGGHYALLHNKHGRCRPQCFRRFIPIINLWTQGMATLDNKGMVGTIYVEDH